MTERRRTVEWSDPLALADEARRLGGEEFLERLVKGALPMPPVARTLDFHLTEVRNGRAVFEFTPQEFHYNPIGSVQGGVHASVFDAALGCAVQSALSAGVAYTTLELSVSFVRTVTKDTGPMRCEAETLSVGRKVATARATLKDAAGKLYAHATTTCLVLTPDAG